MSRSSDERGTSTQCSQVVQRTPMSAPNRTMRQVSPPQGCGFRSVTTSSRYSGSGPLVFTGTMRVSVIRASLAMETTAAWAKPHAKQMRAAWLPDYCGVGEATRQADEGSMAARLSKRCRKSRHLERRLSAHVEPGALIDELELTDDAAGPRHRDVHDLRRSDRSHVPWATDGDRVNGEPAIGGRAEVAPRADPSAVDRDG